MKKETSGNGIGLPGLLQLAFIVLKLCGVINWSWFWVLAPFWGTLTLLVLGVLIGIWLNR